MRTIFVLLHALDTLVGTLLAIAAVVGALAVVGLLWELKQNPGLLPDTLNYLVLLALTAVGVWAVWPEHHPEKEQKQ